jgi:hypothetical protein
MRAARHMDSADHRPASPVRRGNRLAAVKSEVNLRDENSRGRRQSTLAGRSTPYDDVRDKINREKAQSPPPLLPVLPFPCRSFSSLLLAAASGVYSW